MPRVVIVGGRASGKTTFLGLLYAAQVKSGSGVADDFRFHVTLESLEEIAEVFQQLMSGSFPDAGSKEGITEIRFQLQYRKGGSGVLARLRSRRRDSAESTPFHFILVRNLDDRLAQFGRSSSIADGKLRDILECDGMVILVDSRALAVKPEERGVGPLGNYDAAVESLLTMIQRSRRPVAGGVLYPIFVFSKFDSVEPKALRAADVANAPPGVDEPRARNLYGRALLEYNLPKTMARIGVREPRGLRFAAPSWFFSWVQTERARAGEVEKIRLRRTGAAGWEPDYSKEEYLALLESLRKIAGHAGD